MADKMQKLIKVLKRIEKDTKIKKDHPDSLTLQEQVEKHYPDAIELSFDLLLIKGLTPNMKNINILTTAGYECDGVDIKTSKGVIEV